MKFLGYNLGTFLLPLDNLSTEDLEPHIADLSHDCDYR